MKAVLIPKVGRGRGHKCADCRRVLREGEVALKHRRRTAGYGAGIYTDCSETIYWHADCVIAALKVAPKSTATYLQTFDDIRANGSDLLDLAE